MNIMETFKNDMQIFKNWEENNKLLKSLIKEKKKRSDDSLELETLYPNEPGIYIYTHS